MSLSADNVYVFENKFELRFNEPGEGPSAYGSHATLECCMLVVARPPKKGDVYKCEVVTGSYKMPNTNTYYRIPNYAMPREQVLAQHEPFTHKQTSEMSDEALHAHKKYEGNLIVKNNSNQGMSNRTGFKKGMVLQQANRLSKAEKRKYKKIFQAEEAPEEEVAEEEE